MKKVKIFAILLTLVLTVISYTTISANAANYTTQADSLKEMSLFIGTNDGFELDRVPTRAEAAVMLVRLLGKENEVKNGNYNHTFNDVPAWVDKYVGYLYENGLTKGTSATTFSADDDCSSQMYTVFVLRGLGYTEENNSFTYNQAQDFAQTIGLIDTKENLETFSRDDMVAISYSSLFQNKKDNLDKILLEDLVNDNAVDSAIADKYLNSNSLYREYLDKYNFSIFDTSTEIQNTLNAEFNMMDTTFNINQESMITAVKNGDDIIVKQHDVTSFMGNDAEQTSYYTNGWLYIDSTLGKYKTQVHISNINEVIGITENTDAFYLVNDITKSTNSENEMVYSIKYSDTIKNYLGEIFSNNDLFDSVKINSIEIVTTFGTDGKVKSQNVKADISFNLTIDEQSKQVETVFNVTTSIIKTGETVTIELPTDLDQYEDLNALQ